MASVMRLGSSSRKVCDFRIRKAVSRSHRNNFSVTSHQYEYPLRSEAPQISRTKASEATAATMSKVVALKGIELKDTNDPFDDCHTLTEEEREETRRKLNSQIPTQISDRHKIKTVKPFYIPPNLPSKDLEVPTTKVSTLSNGLRVASQETYGQVSTVGVFANVGSRYETEETTGINHLMELLAFQSTETHPSTAEIVARMNVLGGSTFATSSREQFMFCVDILRPSVAEAMEILSSSVLRPCLTTEEVESSKLVMQYQMEDMIPEMKLGEGLHIAAYCNQQLGRPHFATSTSLQHLTPSEVKEFRRKHLLSSPTGMVLSGAGIEHDHLVELAERYFLSDWQSSSISLPDQQSSYFRPSTYTGGEYRLQASNRMDNFTRVAMAFELGGWHSNDLVPTCVLQILLGGGSSFSAGGPGKGMYSRLYREVLNRYYWAEAAEAFTSFHTETGLLGISGSSMPQKSRDMTRVLAEHFSKLASEPVTDEELDRARRMLKCNVLTQLESRLVLFEDIGRQILTYGQREDTATMCSKIDAVTKEDIQALAQRALKKPPTLSSVGEDLSNVPRYDEVQLWFSSQT